MTANIRKKKMHAIVKIVVMPKILLLLLVTAAAANRSKRILEKMTNRAIRTIDNLRKFDRLHKYINQYF